MFGHRRPASETPFIMVFGSFLYHPDISTAVDEIKNLRNVEVVEQKTGKSRLFKAEPLPI